jgi:excisionase family DNA binding protein
MLNLEQAAEALSVSPRTVRRLVRSGQITAAKVGGSIRIRPEALQQFVNESEKRMADDVSSSIVGSNSFGGYARILPTSAVSPGTGTATEAGEGGGGAAWQTWQPADPFNDDEPVKGTVKSGHVSNGIVSYAPEGADPWPGMRPAGTPGGISSTSPDWAVDRTVSDYDIGPSSDVSAPSRPWRSGTRPSDTGFTQAFYPEQSGQIPPAVDSTGLTGPRRLRRDDGAEGVLP